MIFVHADEIIARIIAQSGRQPGLSVILSMLLSFEHDEIYFKFEPSLVGKTFYEAIFLFRKCCAIGLMFSDQRIKICPPIETIIGPSDSIILIAEDDDQIQICKTFSIENTTIDYFARHDFSKKHRIRNHQTNVEKNLILGWNSKATLIARQLDNYVSEGSELHILTNLNKATKIITEQLVNELHKQKLFLHCGNITNRLDLEKLNL